MSAQTANCSACPVRGTCLPFNLGLAGDTNPLAPRRTIERSSCELVLENGGLAGIVVVRVGWSARYVMFPDGRRQIVDIALPGGFIGCSEIAGMPESLPMVALSEVEACVFDRASFMSAVMTSPQIIMEVMSACGAKSVRLRNLLAAMGQQSGAPRVAAFLADLHRRLDAIGQVNNLEMPYPLRQQDLADTLGMTQVHVSRTLRGLAEDKVLAIQGKTLRILNLEKLERLAKA